LLAQVHWKMGTDRKRAIAQARAAQRVFAEFEDDANLAAVDAWLADKSP
jgi:hypothetical protein